MASDAVIGGMVNAVVQEAAEQINSKEAQLAILNERVHSTELDAFKDSQQELSLKNVELSHEVEPQHYSNTWTRETYVDCFRSLKVAAEEQLLQLHRLNHENECLKSYVCSKELSLGSEDMGLCLQQDKISRSFVKMGVSIDALIKLTRAIYQHIDENNWLPKESVCDHEWKWDFQKKLDTIIFQNYIRGLREEFDYKLRQERKISSIQNRSWSKRYDDLSALRKELDAINKSFSFELGHLILQCGPDCVNDRSTCNTSTKDNTSHKTMGNHLLRHSSHAQENGGIAIKSSEISMPEVGEFPLLMHMSKEELITHFKTEITDMKRYHESVLQGKTEELFRVKRELLKERGPSPLRKYREFEVIRKKIPEFILKLDNILAENEPVVEDDQNDFCFKDRINELLFENQHLKDLLADKRKELKLISVQVSDAANQMSSHSSAEAELLRQLKKLRQDMEDVRIEIILRDVIHDIVLKDWLVEIMRQQKSILEAETTVIHEIYKKIWQGLFEDVNSCIDTATTKFAEEKTYLVERLSQEEKALCLEIKMNKKLEHNIESLSMTVAEKKKSAKGTASALLQQKDIFEVTYQELISLKIHANKQKELISHIQKELDLVRGKVKEAFDQVHHCEVEKCRLSEELSVTLNHLKEAVSQKEVLQRIIKEKEGIILSSTAEKRELREEMRSIAICVIKLSKSFEEFESEMTKNIQKNTTRLEKLYQGDSLNQHVDSLRREILWCRQNLEIKSSNIQKAEMEVDLLGDEVDALLSIFAKMYIALDHYSPVLQHYPGVLEILKLIRRKLEGNVKQT